MNIRNAYEYIEKGYVDNFELDEWPVPEDLKYVDYRIIKYLDELREKFGYPVYPSQVPAGLVRRSGSRTSRHYIGDGQLGQAVDVFPSTNSLDFWMLCVEDSRLFGVGIYLDTNINAAQPQPMIHIDLDDSRSERAFWVRDGEYYLKSDDPEDFWKKLAKAHRP